MNKFTPGIQIKENGIEIGPDLFSTSDVIFKKLKKFSAFFLCLLCTCIPGTFLGTPVHLTFQNGSCVLKAVQLAKWWYLFLDLSTAKLYLWERSQMIGNCVQMSVFNLLTNSMSVNGQVYDIANQHTGFLKHFIYEKTLSRSDSPTCDQDISRIKYTRGANFTKLCRRHRETSTTNETD